MFLALFTHVHIGIIKNKILLDKTMIKTSFTSSMSLKNRQPGSVVENDMNAELELYD